MKKSFYALVCVLAVIFLASSCDSLWNVQKTSTTSLNLNVQSVLPMSIQNKGTTLKSIKSTVPAFEETAKNLKVLVSLHNSIDGAEIISKTLTLQEAQTADVVFEKLTVGQSVYANIQILNPEEGKDPLFFRARSANTVLVKNENILTARVNAVFVRPDLEGSFSGYTPYDTVNTLEEAVEVLGGVGNFMPDATVYVDGTITVTKDTVWNYPGLTITNNSEQTVVQLGEIDYQNPSEENQIEVAITGVSFKGNPNLETTNGFIDVVNAMLTLKDVSMTGHKSPEPGLGALNISPNAQNFVSFDGNVNISENTANGQPSNVAVWLGDSVPNTYLAVSGALSLNASIHIDPIGLHVYSPYPITLVMNEGGTFTEDNFVVAGYETSIRDGDGSLMVTGMPIKPSETGTIEFYEINASGSESPLSDISETIRSMSDGSGGSYDIPFSTRPGYITEMKKIVTENWKMGDEAHIVEVTKGFGTYVSDIVSMARDHGFIVTATLDGENTLKVILPYIGQVVFLDAAGNAIKDGLSTFTFPGSWGSGDESHILTIVGADVVGFTEYVKTAPDSEYDAEDKKYVAELDLPNFTVSHYLDAWVNQVIQDNLNEGAIPATITQMGNVLTVQIIAP